MLLSAALLASGFAPASADPDPSFTIHVLNRGESLEVDANGDVHAPPVKQIGASLEEARTAAAERGHHSYRDMSAVDGQSAPIPPGANDAPPGPIEDQCRRDPGSKGKVGRVWNRFLWCQDHGFTAVAVNTNGQVIGGATLNYVAIGFGNVWDRSVQIYFKQTSVKDYWGVFQNPDIARWRFDVRCGSGSEPGCTTHGQAADQTFTQWANDSSWHKWTVRSDENYSGAPDKLLRHTWTITGDVTASTPGGVGPSIPTAYHVIRCDSATYFSGQPLACVFDEVVPFLTYNTGGPEATSVREVALHIRHAQNSPNLTLPNHGASKVIPGKYTGDPKSAGLHRIPYLRGNTDYSANRAEVERACDRKPPYQDTGHPPYDTGTQDCDEYPFAVTQEGAASPIWDFSVRAVNNRQNRRAGNYLQQYHKWDRILYGQNDNYYVHIAD